MILGTYICEVSTNPALIQEHRYYSSFKKRLKDLDRETLNFTTFNKISLIWLLIMDIIFLV